MIAKTIVDSDAFLMMPQTAQLLYFHLSIRADDDGFINRPNAIARLCGCGQSDLDELLDKRFVISFDSGVVVIKHWHIHNYIRKDAYKETVYRDEKLRLRVKENRAYTLDDEPKGKHIYGSCKNVLLTDAEMDTLKKDYGEATRQKIIEELSTYKGASGRTYKSDYLAICRWVANKVAPNQKSIEPSGALQSVLDLAMREDVELDNE